MLKNTKDYTRREKQFRSLQLGKLSLKEGVRQLEELLSLYGSFRIGRKKPLPLSVKKSLDKKLKSIQKKRRT